ncbi:MAG: thioesterase family protein [Lutibacter sp.]|nr:thioesterase family protein [Lutibacter sp.]MDT8418771.1 thioesterase family protein [Lutibacter sp.]
MIKNRFRFTLTVTEADLDALNHVNNVTYLHWVQNVAEKHWSAIGNTNIDNKYVWVVIRHEIDYFLPAMLHDKITINTYIGDSYGVKSERFVEIKKADKLLVKAKTIWCLLDQNTMKPVKVPSEIMTILLSKKGIN